MSGIDAEGKGLDHYSTILILGLDLNRVFAKRSGLPGVRGSRAVVLEDCP